MSRAPFMLRNVVTNAMEVVVYATGLQPGVAQPEHIHAGPCNTISPVQFPLLDLVSDAMGRAIAGTGLIGVTSVSGMSVHIHATNYAMLACGDIAASGTSGMARAGR
jgi:hypothetical protein